MACHWVMMRSSYCPYLVRIESNADFLSRFHGWLFKKPQTDCVTPMSTIIMFECSITHGYFFNSVNNIIITKGFSVHIYVK